MDIHNSPQDSVSQTHYTTCQTMINKSKQDDCGFLENNSSKTLCKITVGMHVGFTLLPTSI